MEAVWPGNLRICGVRDRLAQLPQEEIFPLMVVFPPANRRCQPPRLKIRLLPQTHSAILLHVENLRISVSSENMSRILIALFFTS